jgi:hypothetical protein
LAFIVGWLARDRPLWPSAAAAAAALNAATAIIVILSGFQFDGP